ncbi:trithorax group protein osa [Eupeodes corollae]|uniref:trithorax group protein osa n=1 Tax=Eupeodes corollae TaxID=290404 RepID=UPI0024919DDD|nr:trithorax group protein osa [Eupeodes corollae]
MTILRIACILAIASAAPIQGILSNGGIGDSYGPPPRGLPAQSYGPPQHQIRVPQREYGVPQQIPFREYGPPALKYGPPKLNFNFGQNFNGGFNDQIKSYFGVPKPFYGPPHLQHTPAATYGPPPQNKPYSTYGPPPKPQGTYGPPRPAASYGPPSLPQPLPLVQPGIFKPNGNGFISRPHTSYGPPPSGQFIGKPNLNYGPPKPSYGPPPLPNFNRQPTETTIIVTSGSGGNGGFQGGHHSHGGGAGAGSGPLKQVQIQVENQGNNHGHGGSSGGHFHTASCDGWKPIPAPFGHYVEHNNIQTQSGYSTVSSGSGHNTVTQYSSIGGENFGGLTDEQLVAVALQTGGFETAPTQSLPASGPVDFHSGGGHGGEGEHHLNSIESENLQIALGSLEDTYSKAPQDSFAPNSVHAQKYNSISSGEYGAPPIGSGNGGNFQGNANHQHHHHHHSEGNAGSFSSQGSNLGILYGTQSGNQRPWLNNALAPPSNPVTYRPPVPQGLLESIGATVQHLDQFGVKPLNQPATYIPPPLKEIAEPSSQYGPPQQQLLPPQQNVNIEFHHQGGGSQNQYQQNYREEERGNALNQYLPPPLPVPVPQQQQQYLPPPRPSHQLQGSSFGGSSSFGGGQQQFIHTQGLPFPHEARFNQPQDCGHGPNLVGANYQLQQQQFVEQGAGRPALSYGPPPSAPGSGPDSIGYESKRSSVTSLPEEVNSENLPGLDGLNVISAQKSQSVSLPVQNSQVSPYQIQIQSSNPSESVTSNDGDTNHEEVLSQGLLQSILSAIEQPQANNNQGTTAQSLQNRSDVDVHLDEDAKEKDSTLSATKAIVPESSETSDDAAEESK